MCLKKVQEGRQKLEKMDVHKRVRNLFKGDSSEFDQVRAEAEVVGEQKHAQLLSRYDSDTKDLGEECIASVFDTAYSNIYEKVFAAVRSAGMEKEPKEDVVRNMFEAHRFKTLKTNVEEEITQKINEIQIKTHTRLKQELESVGVQFINTRVGCPLFYILSISSVARRRIIL